MKKEMTLNYSSIDETNDKQVVEMVMDSARIPGQWLRKYYSAIIGHEISSGQAWLITRTQIALIATILTAGHSVLLLAVSAIWFAVSLLKCKLYI